MIKEWIDTYKPQNNQEMVNALREIMQEIALAGLERSGFFEEAAFYGGTALRIFYGLDRFSEDLDFSLLAPKSNFSFENHFKAIENEFEAIGMKVSITTKQKTVNTQIESAFLKSNTIWQELVLESSIPQLNLGQLPNLKIKLEIDTNPPLGFNTEEKLLLKPFSFYVKCFDGPSLFAGKIHALLYRKWKNNLKGRDWYDFEWYIKKGISLNKTHFLERAISSGVWNKNNITSEEIIELIHKRIAEIDFEKVKTDITRFIINSDRLNIWSKKYFEDLMEHMKIEK